MACPAVPGHTAAHRLLLRPAIEGCGIGVIYLKVGFDVKLQCHMARLWGPERPPKGMSVRCVRSVIVPPRMSGCPARSKNGVAIDAAGQ